MLKFQESRGRRRNVLGINVERLPEIDPCSNCNSLKNIEILYSTSERTFAITCVVDEWITGEHGELFEAIQEWNQHHHSARSHPKNQNARLN